MNDSNTAAEERRQRYVELLEEQNELLREQLQMMGDLVNAVDKLTNGLSSTSSVTNVVNAQTSSAARVEDIRETVKQYADLGAPRIHQEYRDKVVAGCEPTGKPAGVSIFWPTKSKTEPGWVRVKLTYAEEYELDERIEKGCVCGCEIVSKHAPSGEEFYGCKNASRSGGCPYRPYVDLGTCSITFNVPHHDFVKIFERKSESGRAPLGPTKTR